MKNVTLLITTLLLLNSSNLKSQNVINFNTTKSVMRQKQLDKTWGNWFEFGNINNVMKEKINVDLLSMSMTLEIVMGKDTDIVNYKIIDFESDFEYQEMGLWVLKFHAIDLAEKKIEEYKIGFKQNKKCIMLFENNLFQYKTEMIHTN